MRIRNGAMLAAALGILLMSGYQAVQAFDQEHLIDECYGYCQTSYCDAVQCGWGECAQDCGCDIQAFGCDSVFVYSCNDMNCWDECSYYTVNYLCYQ
jgi:hypothetical protein